MPRKPKKTRITVIDDPIKEPVPQADPQPVTTEEHLDHTEFWKEVQERLLVQAYGFLLNAKVADPDGLRQWRRDYRKIMGEPK